MQAAKDASPDTFWDGRLYVANQPLDNPMLNASDFVQKLVARADQFQGTIDALEGYNEVGLSSAYTNFEIYRCRALTHYGWKSVVGNFSGGTPELEDWPKFYPALDAGDYLGLHEYSANTQPPFMPYLDTWLCRRYQRVYESLPNHLRLPLIITECGIDGGMIERPQEGWKSYTDEAGYLADLEWYDNSLQADANRWPIVGATIYCYGHVNPRWGTFDLGGSMAERLESYMQANPPLPWKAPEETPPDPPPGTELARCQEANKRLRIEVAQLKDQIRRVQRVVCP